MIVDFTLNKETDTATLKLGGDNFHHDLHLMCQIVSKENRSFNGAYWSIKYASQYAKECTTRWPEFTQWVEDFQKQIELPIQVPVAQPDGTPYKH